MISRNNRSLHATRPRKRVLVTRERLVQLIETFIYNVGAYDFIPSGTDRYRRELLSEQIAEIEAMATEIGYDLWAETAMPLGVEREMPLAMILRRVDHQHGTRGRCAVPHCRQRVTALRLRPAHLPHGTQWPTCPELCFAHAHVRHEILLERVTSAGPLPKGPISAGMMPFPGFAHLAPDPIALRESSMIT